MTINPRKLTASALLTAAALALFVIELQLPPLTPFPGVKIGLANTITLFALYLGGNWTKRDAVLILTARVLLGALVTGNLTALMFSAVGGGLAVTVMCLCGKVLPIPAASVCGSLAHIAGQLIVASGIYGSVSVLYYLPALMLSGIAAGLLTGTAVAVIYKAYPKFIAWIRNM